MLTSRKRQCEQARFAQQKILREVDADVLQRQQRCAVGDILGDGLASHDVTDFIGETHHLVIDPAVRHHADEGAVDFDEVDGNLF